MNSVSQTVILTWLFMISIAQVIGQDLDQDNISDSLEMQLAEKFAPHWYFHKNSSCSQSKQNQDEQHFPSSIEWLQEEVEKNGKKLFVKVQSGTKSYKLLVNDLGSLSSLRDTISGLILSDPKWTWDTEDLTLEGYPKFLKGDPQNFPTYFRCWRDESGKILIAYFLFYPFDYKGYQIPFLNTGDHRGDFEGITISLTGSEDGDFISIENLNIEEIFFGGHGPQKIVRANDLCLIEETHPQVFISWGSHACYPQPGEWHNYKAPGPNIYDDFFHGNGLEVESWSKERELINVGEEQNPLVGWLNYKGKWGPDGTSMNSSPPSPPKKSFWKSSRQGRVYWDQAIKETLTHWDKKPQLFPCNSFRPFLTQINSQEANISFESNPDSSLDIRDKIFMYWDSSGKINFDSIRSLMPHKGWTKYYSCLSRDRTFPGNYWVYFKVQNNSQDSLTFMLKALNLPQKGSVQHINAYWGNGNNYELLKAGNLTNLKEKAFKYNKNVIPLSIGPNQSKECFVRLSTHRNYPTGFLLKISSQSYEESSRKEEIISNIGHYILSISYVAILLMFMIYSLVQYAEVKDKTYLIYALYLFFIIIYQFRIISWDPSPDLFFLPTAHIVQWHYHIELTIVVPIYLLYMWFIDRLLSLKETKPILHKTLIFTSVGWLVIYFVDHLVRAIWGIHISMIAYDYYRAAFIPVGVFFIYGVYKIPGRLSFYIITGTLSLLLGGLFEVLFSAKDFLTIDRFGPVFGRSMIIFQIGAVLENVFFMAGLAHKSSLQLKEKAELERKISDSQMKALKAQMNPHFIFNSLSGISNLIGKRQNSLANDYLIKFSRLIRLILENAEETHISLYNEVKICEEYVALQQMRFSKSFYFKKTIFPGEDEISSIDIPPFTLQTYLENSIEHGLRSKPGKKNLELSIQIQGNILSCKIDDNGIGREASRLLQKENPKLYKNKSLGIRNTLDRIQLSNELNQSGIEVETIDKEENGKPSGTQVIITIPI